jgi:type IX secretion system PorP/SprF family membrane protein
MKKEILLIAVFYLVFLSIRGQQDRHYSMFNESPMALNAGATGLFSGDVQLFTSYRSQWSSINPNMFTTISASLDAKVYEKDGYYFAAGINFYDDKGGDSFLKTGIYNLSLSAGIEVGEDQYLAIGFQPSYYQRSIELDKLSWGNQWSGEQFNVLQPSGESSFAESIVKFDLNSGVYYYGQIQDNLMVTLGGSVAHITRPSVGFLSPDEKLYRRYTLNASAEYGISNSKIYLDPSAYVFFQGPNRSVAIGTDLKYMFKESSKYTGYFDEKSFLIGMYYRSEDSFYAKLGLNWAGISFGAAYDINISSLSIATNGLGGMEFFLRYRIGFEGKYNGFK